jgi:hypothetical protein
MSRLHVVAQFTFRIVPSVALTTGDSSHLWLCHVGLPPKSSLDFFNRANSTILSQDIPNGGKGNRSFMLWKNVMAVENMQGDTKASSANEHRKTSAGYPLGRLDAVSASIRHVQGFQGLDLDISSSEKENLQRGR